jgi:thiol-disulfide isomerase/thioredoxin
MNPRILIIILGFLLQLSSTSSAQVREVKFNTIDSLLHFSPEMPIVINFWATWCKPCVQELPYFEELHKKYSASGVKVVMVSLDFKRELESRVKPFVQKNNMASEVLLLNEPDYNSWINRVDSSWSGAIPATVIISKNKREFFEKEFASYSELENSIKPYINSTKKTN